MPGLFNTILDPEVQALVRREHRLLVELRETLERSRRRSSGGWMSCCSRSRTSSPSSSSGSSGMDGEVLTMTVPLVITTVPQSLLVRVPR